MAEELRRERGERGRHGGVWVGVGELGGMGMGMGMAGWDGRFERWIGKLEGLRPLVMELLIGNWRF